MLLTTIFFLIISFIYFINFTQHVFTNSNNYNPKRKKNLIIILLCINSKSIHVFGHETPFNLL